MVGCHKMFGRVIMHFFLQDFQGREGVILYFHLWYFPQGEDTTPPLRNGQLGGIPPPPLPLCLWTPNWILTLWFIRNLQSKILKVKFFSAKHFYVLFQFCRFYYFFRVDKMWQHCVFGQMSGCNSCSAILLSKLGIMNGHMATATG